jgi:orotidine-5'-phosphate decarboxylase
VNTAGKEKIIVALDVDSLEKAEGMVKDLATHVGCFKVGLELITSVGAPQAVNFIHSLGGKVFLDGKFNDIPNTIARSARAASALGVSIFNVHASSGIEAMTAAVANKGSSAVLAVTVLTSLEENNAHLIFGGPSKMKVLQFARDAEIAGCCGIICSPQELSFLAKQNELSGMLKITPGIRSAGDPPDDQKRTMTPAEAIKAGATALVIGRPITKAPSPVEAAQKIAEEIDTAIAEMRKK